MEKSMTARILKLLNSFKRILYPLVHRVGLNCRMIFGLRCHKEKIIIVFSLLIIFASLFGCVPEGKQNSTTNTQVSETVTVKSETDTESLSSDSEAKTKAYELSRKDTVSYTSRENAENISQTNLTGETAGSESEQSYVSGGIELPDDMW